MTGRAWGRASAWWPGVVVALFVIGWLWLAVAWARTATTVGEGSGLRMAADTAAKGALGVWLAPAPSPAAPLPVMARALDLAGAPTGAAVQLGVAIPDAGRAEEHVVAVAADTHRHDFLVAWSGWEPGLPNERCSIPQAPMAPPPGPCHRYRTEIFTRLVGSDGQPLGPARRITTTGPPARIESVAIGPEVAADPGGHGFLVTYTAFRDPDHPAEGVLLARRVDAPGIERGAAFRIGGQSAYANNPVSLLAGRGRDGYLLVFTWGLHGRNRLYTQPLDRRGRGLVSARLISQRSGPGAASIQLAVNPQQQRALVLFFRAIPNSSAGPLVRLLSMDGLARSGFRQLPYPDGFGPVAVTADGTGWRYAWISGSQISAYAVLTQTADRSGRPIGLPERLSSSDEHPAGAVLSDSASSQPIVGWTDIPWSAGPGSPPTQSLVRTTTT